jgi:heat shock protein HslJ
MNKSWRVLASAGALVALLVAVLALTLTSQAGAGPELNGTRWTLAALNGRPVDGSGVSLEFASETELGGNAGCNSYGATYAVVGDALRLEPVVSTLMLCAGEAVNNLETEYLAALDQVERFELDGGRLILKDAAGAELLVFNRA